jgi:hypothetical protein
VTKASKIIKEKHKTAKSFGIIISMKRQRAIDKEMQ